MTDQVFALAFAGLLTFMVGIFLLFCNRNLLRIVLAVEVLAKGTTLMLLAGGVRAGMTGLMQSLIVTFIIVETILAGILLAIIVICQRTNKSLDVTLLSRLKG
jgi:multisubunit Na+/H+ antiporter MnhC subunit